MFFSKGMFLNASGIPFESLASLKSGMFSSLKKLSSRRAAPFDDAQEKKAAAERARKIAESFDNKRRNSVPLAYKSISIKSGAWSGRAPESIISERLTLSAIRWLVKK